MGVGALAKQGEVWASCPRREDLRRLPGLLQHVESVFFVCLLCCRARSIFLQELQVLTIFHLGSSLLLQRSEQKHHFSRGGMLQSSKYRWHWKICCDLCYQECRESCLIHPFALNFYYAVGLQGTGDGILEDG